MHRIELSPWYIPLLGLLLWAAIQAVQINALAEDTRAAAPSVDAVQAEWETLQQQQTQHPSRTLFTKLSSEGTEDNVIPIRHDIPLSAELQEFTVTICRENDIDPDILFNLMRRESGFQVDAWCVDTNGYESNGVCQINGITHSFLAERGIDPTESPEANIAAAVELITYYRDERGYSTVEALSAYGSGTGGMWSERSMAKARALMEGAHQ